MESKDKIAARTHRPTREIPHVFGDYRNLMGVMNLACSSDDRRDTAVIMVTAGMAYQVGPFRMHVELARALSAERVPSFRFDLSRINDSRASTDKGGLLHRTAREIQDAMDVVQSEYGIEKFFLFGMRSGADESFYVAEEDKRVFGAALMDGCGYKTSRHTMEKLLGHYLRRAVNPQRWIDAVNRRFNQQGESMPLPMWTDIREFPQQREAALQIQSMVDRDVRLRFIYSGGSTDIHSPESQSWAMRYDDTLADVGSNKFVSTICLPAIDHTTFPEKDRQRLVADIVYWASANIPKRAPLAGNPSIAGGLTAAPTLTSKPQASS